MQNQPTSKNDEAKNIMDSYSNILEIWKVQNDNYFKRVQVLMSVLQVGLLLAALKLLSSSLSPYKIPFVVLIGFSGILSAGMWIKQNEKQSQYMEFCRRVLRNLEARLAGLKIPLEYFSFESLVFRPDRDKLDQEIIKRFEKLFYSATHRHDNQNKQLGHWLYFNSSEDRFPEPESSNNNYSMDKVSGGLISYEKFIAWGVIGFWCIFIVIILFT